jgi:hypothetical protein
MAVPRKIESYEDLEVWQLAMTLAEQCYQLTATFPREETYGLSAQIRRAAVSIPANIAEGYGRNQTGNFLNFLFERPGINCRCICRCTYERITPHRQKFL